MEQSESGGREEREKQELVGGQTKEGNGHEAPQPR